MTATAHAIVGAVIGSQIGNPLIALPLSLLSHFALDKIPHWDTMTNKNKTRFQALLETGIDTLVGFGLIILIFMIYLHNNNPAYLFLNAFAAQLPDWLEAPYLFTKIKIPISYQAYQLQHWTHDLWFDSRLKAPWGIVTQAGVVATFLVWATH